MESIDEELQVLENKTKQLKLEYEQYFLGTRPREPAQLRAEVQKIIFRHSNQPIKNTAARFRFNSMNSRFQAFKRQWDLTLRQIEARIAGLKPPDIEQLEKRAGAIGAILNEAPAGVPEVDCAKCGVAATVNRETHSGFSVPCPRCTHQLMIRLKVDE